MINYISLIIFFIGLSKCYSLNCRSEGGLKNDELKKVYNNCLKQNDGKNSSNSNKDSFEREWRESHSNSWNEDRNDNGRNYNSKDRIAVRGRNRLDGKLENFNNNYQYNAENGMQRREHKINGRNQYSQYESSYNQHDMNRRYGENGNENRPKSYTNGYENNYNSNGQEYQNEDYGSNMYSQNSRRYKRERRVQMNSGQRSQYNPNIQRTDEKSRAEQRNSTGHNQSGEDCAMHCFLENLKMTGEDGLPDRYLMTNTMTKDVRNEDLREFLQESVEECFQILDNENTDDKCEFSKNILICLSEKGRANCDDWKDDFQFI